MNNRLKETRERQGLTQSELAKKSSVSRTIISGIESGRVNETSTKTLKDLANALGKDVRTIFFTKEV